MTVKEYSYKKTNKMELYIQSNSLEQNVNELCLKTGRFNIMSVAKN